MRYELLIATRYLRAKRQVALVTVISVIAGAGVAIGVAALICTLAVFNGFSNVVTNMLVGFDPHVRVEGEGRKPLTNGARLQEIVKSTPDVTGFAPVVSGRLMAVNENVMRPITVRGVTDAITEASGLSHAMLHGRFDISRGRDAMPGIVLGVVLADRLRLTKGDTITLVSPVGIEAAYTQFTQPLMMRFRVTGMYATMNKEYDGNYAYVALDAAQYLFDRSADEIDGIDIRLVDIRRAESVKSELQSSLAAAGVKARVQSWYDLHRDIYSVMEVERWIAYILLSMIIGVAAFTILGSLTMTVIEKQRDISLLKAVGATDAGVRKIFLFAGIAIGIGGSVAGAVLGYAVCWAQQTFHLFKLSSQFVIPALPIEMRAVDFLEVCASAIFLCAIAALYPARRAARAIPAEGLRWE